MKKILIILIALMLNLNAAHRDALFTDFTITEIEINNDSVTFRINGDVELCVLQASNDSSDSKWKKSGKKAKFVKLNAKNCLVTITKCDNEKLTNSYKKLLENIKNKKKIEKRIIIGKASFGVNQQGYVDTITGTGATFP